MPSPAVRIPQYRLHKPSGRAVVTLGDKDHYLGPYGSEQSKAEYERLIGEWLARGRVTPAGAGGEGGGGPSINEVMLAYVIFAEGYYRDSEGQPTRELETMKLAFRPLKALYGRTAAAEFGPLALKAVRQRMIDSGLARTVVNQRVGYVKRMFQWAAGEQVVPPAVYHGLLCVKGLQRGRSAARETEPVGPVPDAHVEAFLPPTVRAMVGLQRLTGMRSGELVRMRACDIDTTGPVWLYRPPKHKTAHLGRTRVVALGAKCRALIRPLLGLDPAAPLFSPRRAQAERDEARRAARKSRVQPSQLSRRKPAPKRTPGASYNPRSYYFALRFGMRAAQKAGSLAQGEFWHPHQLRHTAAARIQREQSLEAARAFLGHAKLNMTAHYAGVDANLAVSVAEKSG